MSSTDSGTNSTSELEVPVQMLKAVSSMLKGRAVLKYCAREIQAQGKCLNKHGLGSVAAAAKDNTRRCADQTSEMFSCIGKIYCPNLQNEFFKAIERSRDSKNSQEHTAMMSALWSSRQTPSMDSAGSANAQIGSHANGNRVYTMGELRVPYAQCLGDGYKASELAGQIESAFVSVWECAQQRDRGTDGGSGRSVEGKGTLEFPSGFGPVSDDDPCAAAMFQVELLLGSIGCPPRLFEDVRKCMVANNGDDVACERPISALRACSHKFLSLAFGHSPAPPQTYGPPSTTPSTTPSGLVHKVQ